MFRAHRPAKTAASRGPHPRRRRPPHPAQTPAPMFWGLARDQPIASWVAAREAFGPVEVLAAWQRGRGGRESLGGREDAAALRVPSQWAEPGALARTPHCLLDGR